MDYGNIKRPRCNKKWQNNQHVDRGHYVSAWKKKILYSVDRVCTIIPCNFISIFAKITDKIKVRKAK